MDLGFEFDSPRISFTTEDIAWHKAPLQIDEDAPVKSEGTEPLPVLDLPESLWHFFSSNEASLNPSHRNSCSEPEAKYPVAALGSAISNKVRKTCVACAKDHKLCSGPPGPCKKCISKGIECVFELAKVPGPKKKHLLTTDESKTSEGKDVEARKRRLVDDTASSSSSRSVYLSSHRPAAGDLSQFISDLKSYHFIDPNIGTASAFKHQSYYTLCISHAISLWYDFFGGSDLNTMSKRDFLDSFRRFQASSIERQYGLENSDLEKLWWLSGVEKTSLDEILEIEPQMLKHQVGLIFLWLGPATAKTFISAPEAVRLIYSYVVENFGIKARFEGFCSRHSACEKLRQQGPGPHSMLFRLNEGRVEIVDECVQTEFGEEPRNVRVALKTHSAYYMRNLVRSRYPTAEDLMGLEFSEDTLKNLSDEAFVHELLLSNSYSETGELRGHEEPTLADRLKSTRQGRYRWFNC